MTHMEKCKALRADTAVHYNCAQAVLIPFAAEMGVTEEQANKMGAHFGSGMRHGSTCGAITGALMVLGALGYGEEEARGMIQRFRQANGYTDCAHLLAAAKERQQVKKDNCDELVYQCIEALHQLVGK